MQQQKTISVKLPATMVAEIRELAIEDLTTVTGKVYELLAEQLTQMGITVEPLKTEKK